MTSKKTLEYCAPEVKEIALSTECVICGSYGDAGKPGKALDPVDDEEDY